jgi:hypothetical protein
LSHDHFLSKGSSWYQENFAGLRQNIKMNLETASRNNMNVNRFETKGDPIRISARQADRKSPSDNKHCMKTKTTLTVWLALFGLLLAPNARAFYNPTTGRWLNRDPVGERGGRNLLAFCRNTPVAAHDRLGLDSYTFKRETVRDGLLCLERCYCDPTEFFHRKDSARLSADGPIIIEPNDWIYFKLFYPEWTGEGCRCVYFGWDGDVFLKASRRGGYGRACCPIFPT